MHTKISAFFSKNKKGFSLIELIIVVAIMVSLVVVMAPSYIKYVHKSRDAVVQTAAEDLISFAKSEFAAMNLSGSCKITVFTEDAHLKVKIEDLYEDKDPFIYCDQTIAEGGDEAFIKAIGADRDRNCSSTTAYIITIDGTIYSRPLKIDVRKLENEN